jgi:hypothetical protein
MESEKLLKLVSEVSKCNLYTLIQVSQLDYERKRCINMQLTPNIPSEFKEIIDLGVVEEESKEGKMIRNWLWTYAFKAFAGGQGFRQDCLIEKCVTIHFFNGKIYMC